MRLRKLAKVSPSDGQIDLVASIDWPVSRGGRARLPRTQGGRQSFPARKQIWLVPCELSRCQAGVRNSLPMPLRLTDLM